MSPGKFSQLVEEQNPAMGEGDLSGGWNSGATTDQGGPCRGVMRRPKRWSRQKHITQPGVRPDQGDFDRAMIVQRGQDARETPGQHRLASPRRPMKQDVVASRRRYLQRSFRHPLAPNVDEVGD
jgi:hypothetical protein